MVADINKRIAALRPPPSDINISSRLCPECYSVPIHQRRGFSLCLRMNVFSIKVAVEIGLKVDGKLVILLALLRFLLFFSSVKALRVLYSNLMAQIFGAFPHVSIVS